MATDLTAKEHALDAAVADRERTQKRLQEMEVEMQHARLKNATPVKMNEAPSDALAHTVSVMEADVSRLQLENAKLQDDLFRKQKELERSEADLMDQVLRWPL